MDFKRSVFKDLVNWKNKHTGRVLELQGARQVGKTYILKKFAQEQFAHMIYISMAEVSGERFLECIHEANTWKPGTPQPEDELKKAVTLFDVNFVDSSDVVIIIDEIQESKEVYNKIRTFAREFDCFVIITGSYLGKLLDEDYFLPAGDTDILEMGTLSFKEFLDIYEKLDLYDSLDLYGESSQEDYDTVRKYFDIYKRIGGYPAVVSTYLQTQDYLECETQLWTLMTIFINESKRYFKDIIDEDVFEKLFRSIGILMLREKTGIRDMVSEVSKITYQEESGRITKKMINHAIRWLSASHIIGYASKCVDCNHLDIKEDSRIYFSDIGMTNYFLRQVGASESDIKGLVSENFVFLMLKKRIRVELSGAMPSFAIWQKTKGELDFYVKGFDQFSYGIEVKGTDQAAKTARAIFDAGKLDYLYYLKGSSSGGKAEDGRLLTVPLYLADRIRLDFGKEKID